MPLWHIYCPENAYSAEDKCAFATRITDLYADVGLPRFYASVVFHELPRNSFLSADRQRTILSGSGLIRLLARLLPSGERGGWNASTLRSIPSYASGVIAGRSTLTNANRFLDHSGDEAAGPRFLRLKSVGSKRTARRHMAECGRNLQRADRGERQSGPSHFRRTCSTRSI